MEGGEKVGAESRHLRGGTDPGNVIYDKLVGMGLDGGRGWTGRPGTQGSREVVARDVWGSGPKRVFCHVNKGLGPSSLSYKEWGFRGYGVGVSVGDKVEGCDVCSKEGEN